MKIRICITAGIISAAVFMGALQALSSPRKKEAADNIGKEERPPDGNCDGINLP